jgi:class 3 adenylate cyclase
MVRQSRSGRILAAVLFTDMVDSTAIAEELGDRRWKVLVESPTAWPPTTSRPPATASP